MTVHLVTDEEEAAAASPRSETEGEEATAPAEREADIGTSSFEKYLPTLSICQYIYLYIVLVLLRVWEHERGGSVEYRELY